MRSYGFFDFVVLVFPIVINFVVMLFVRRSMFRLNSAIYDFSNSGHNSSELLDVIRMIKLLRGASIGVIVLDILFFLVSLCVLGHRWLAGASDVFIGDVFLVLLIIPFVFGSSWARARFSDVNGGV